jgi:GNAT superfamily N-acetyltransferase
LVLTIAYVAPDQGLESVTFLSLVQRVWPGSYEPALIAAALTRTTNITAWDGERLVGCVRLLSDGYLFSTVPEILVDPDYQGQGIGRELMERAYALAPSSLFLGDPAGNEGFFKRLGYVQAMPGYVRRKQRRRLSADGVPADEAAP